MPFTGIWEYIESRDAINPYDFWLDINIYIFFIPFILGGAVFISLELLGCSIQLDDDSTRYLLSAFIQSLAAIIAIVVTLTLVAIQLTASIYSTRVTDVFKKHPAMLATIISYAIGIALFASILITIGDSEGIVGWKKGVIFYLYFLFVGLILILIPYIVVTISHLNAEKAITRIIDQIDFEGIKPKTDPFQPAFDVIYGAILKDDYSTMSHGLKCIVEKFQSSWPDMANSDVNYIALRFFNDIKRCAFKLIEKEEELFVSEVLLRMDDIIFEKKGIEEIVLRNNNISLNYSITTMEEICKRATSKKMISVISHCIGNLDVIEKYSKQSQIDGFDRSLIAKSYGIICDVLIQNNNQHIATECIHKLSRIIDENISNDENMTNSAVESLENIAETSVECNSNILIEKSVKKIYEAYIYADSHYLESTRDFIEYELINLRKKYKNKIPELRQSFLSQSKIQDRDYNEELEKFEQELARYKITVGS